MALADDLRGEREAAAANAEHARERFEANVLTLRKLLDVLAREFAVAAAESRRRLDGGSVFQRGWAVPLWLGSKDIDSIAPRESVEIVVFRDGTWRWSSSRAGAGAPSFDAGTGLSEFTPSESDVRAEMLRVLSGGGPR